VYCDYWASVLGIPGIVSPAAERRGLIHRSIFRSCLDRPETRLPGIGYSLLLLLLGPVLIPYRMAQRIASRLHVQRAGEEEANRLLAPYRLRLQAVSPQRVDVSWGGDVVARDLIDPELPDVEFSVVYPAYKVLVAALLAMLLSIGLHAFMRTEHLSDWFETALLFVNFPLLAGFLYLIFRDWVTALMAPLPVFLVLWSVAWIGPMWDMRLGTLPAILIGLAVAYFMVDVFMIPRAMAPTLYLYDNDPDSPYFSYAPEQAPHWVEGRAYWVWRFVTLSHAELHKFWERDWERVEVWVRADGDLAGQVEWVVVDFHFRELWIPYDRIVTRGQVAEHAAALAEARRDRRADVAWVLEVDTDLLGHWPQLRGLFLLPMRDGWRKARIRQLLRSLHVRMARDNPRQYREVVRQLRLCGADFVEDMPEHLRGYGLRQLISIPWHYWRYPRGANASVRRFLYAGTDVAPATSACEPDLQFKAPGRTSVGARVPEPERSAAT
jgi:hypothetical protein